MGKVMDYKLLYEELLHDHQYLQQELANLKRLHLNLDAMRKFQAAALLRQERVIKRYKRKEKNG